MKAFKKTRVLFLLFLMAQTMASASPTTKQADPNPVPKLKRIVWIWLENVADKQMYFQKYIKNIWYNQKSVRLASVLPVSLITQADVFAMIAGTDYNILDNDPRMVDSMTLLSLLEAKNIPWRVYAEDYPGSCYLGVGAGEYKRYRVPFLSLTQIRADRYLCMKVVGFRSLDDDIKYDSMPQFTVVIPNLKNSGATSNLSTAEATLRRVIDPILANAEMMAETTIVVSTVNNLNVKQPEMFTMILGNGVADYGQYIETKYNHYNLLRTLEMGLGLGHLNQNDSKVQPMLGFWK